MKLTTKQITTIAIMGAVSAVLMMFSFSLPFAPGFLKLVVSDLPVIICGFLLGPASGAITAFIKIIINLLLNGTGTMFVGETSNLVLTIAYVLPAAIIYKKNKSKTSAIKGLVISTIVVSVLALASNYFVMFPLYAKLMGLSMYAIVGMASKVNPLVNNVFTMFIFALLPFNLVKYGLVSVICIFTYNHLSHLFKK